jgi:IS30 family transposase
MADCAYHQLTRDARCRIAALKTSGVSPQEIALQLCVHPSTVYRELKRNGVAGEYDAVKADNLAEERRSLSNKNNVVSIDKDVREQAISFLKEHKWSPKQISGRLEEKSGILISHETIYKTVWQDKKEGGDLYKSLRHNGKKYKKRGSVKAGRGCIPNRTDISERPPEVANKDRSCLSGRQVGDFEGDLIIGKQGSGAIVSIVDRCTKLTKLRKVENKEAFPVRIAIQNALLPYKKHLKTITFDNGKEFSYHADLTAVLGINAYFCTPYHSWERGLNEHTNGLVRQFFPKSYDFREITDEALQKVEDLLNNRPRQALNFSTPNEAFIAITKPDSNAQNPPNVFALRP